MGYFQVRYDSRVVIYDHKGFIGLATVYLTTCVPPMIGFRELQYKGLQYTRMHTGHRYLGIYWMVNTKG